MPIEKRPAKPLPKDYQPENGTPYRVGDLDSWYTVSEKFGINPAKLIRFNFQTINSPEVNWYLRRNVGCRKMTRDRQNWMFSSKAVPGIVYIPPKVINMPPVVITATAWHQLSFWMELTTGDLWAYKKVRGVVGMRIDKHPTDWYAWNISASLACANIPIKGSPPIGVGSVRSEEQTLLYNPALLNPSEDWKEKGVWVRLAGNHAWIRIKNALPTTPTADYQPIKGATTRDLVIKVKVDSPQTGWCTGFGGIEDGRKVKPTPRPVSPGRGRYPDVI